MSLILSNAFKRVVAFVLCVLLCLSLSSCTNSTKDINEVDQICVSGSYAESWMYVFTDETFIDEMVSIFNGIEYEKTDASVDMMTVGEVYSFTFSKGTETQEAFIVDKNNNFVFEAGGQVYSIVSEFDFDKVKSLVEGQISNVTNATTSTPDEA